LPISPEAFLELRTPLMNERFPFAAAMAGAEALVRHLSARAFRLPWAPVRRGIISS
jgi:pseudouridine-5'-monophosphatase